MTVQMFKERLVGKYDAISPPTLLLPGQIVDGLNIRRIGQQGGWKVRKGTTLHNTTQISNHNIDSLMQYTHPRNNDYHFLCQMNSLVYEATNDPPTGGTTFGSSIADKISPAISTTSAFWDIVNEHLFIGDGAGVPITWGGDTPFCRAFYGYFDIGGSGADTYTDYTRNVTDNRSTTFAKLHNDADDQILICSNERATGIKMTMGSTVNAQTVTLTVKAWRSDSWTAVSNMSDGTASSGKTLAQTGTISWDHSTSDTMRVIEGVMGYWYQLTFSAALTNAVLVSKCQVIWPMQRITNKWNGVYEWVGAGRLYNDTEYEEHTGDVTSESTAMYMDIGGDVTSTSSYVYVKAAEPVCGIGFGVVAGYENSADAQVDLIEYWDGTAWTTVGTLTDGTLNGAADSSFAQSGTITWNADTLTPARRSFTWDSIPGFWYRVSWDADLTAEVRIWGLTYIPFPETLATTDGCIEFKGRLFTWGDPEYPNRLRYSAKDHPDCFCGTDSGYTEQFGDMDKVLCVRRFYNELMIWKRHEVWLLEGYSPETFGGLRISTTTGVASPQTAHVVETGSPIMHKDEVLSIAIWQEIDGIYVLDGRKPKKISEPIDQYFNIEYSAAIGAAYIRNRQAFIDRVNNEYHLILPSGELVYNYVADEWYPVWSREENLVCGLNLRGSDDRMYVYGGLANGYVMRLENGSVDKDTANADNAISASIKTRAISSEQEQGIAKRLTFRKAFVEAKALDVASTITTKIYPNVADTGVTLSAPQAMDLNRVGYGVATPGVLDSRENLDCFQLEFISGGLDFQIYSFIYEIDPRGELFVV